MWTGASEGGAGFEIHRASGASPFIPHAEVSAGETAWLDVLVEPGVQYHYKVKAAASRTFPTGSQFSNAVSYTSMSLPLVRGLDEVSAIPVFTDTGAGAVGISSGSFAGDHIEVGIVATAEPRGLSDRFRLSAPGVTFSVPKDQLDLLAADARILIIPDWAAQEATGSYAWIVIDTVGEKVEFPLPYDPASPDEPIEIAGSWLAELDEEVGLGDLLRISVYPVAPVQAPDTSGLAQQVMNQEFGLFKVDAERLSTDDELARQCQANRAVYSSGRVARHGDKQEIGDRIPLVFVHGWQSLGNHLAGANPFDNFFKESLFAPQVCAWLKFFESYAADLLETHPSEYALYSFSYDSDQHIVESAYELSAYLESAFEDRPAVIVSHSMGGMVASTVARLQDADEDNPKIGYIISFGSPYRGTPALTCVAETTYRGVPVCGRARVSSNVQGSRLMSAVLGGLLNHPGTRDLAAEASPAATLISCGPHIANAAFVIGSPIVLNCPRSRVAGIDNPFLADLNQYHPDPKTHYSIIGALNPSTVSCKQVGKPMDMALQCTARLLLDNFGYTTDGIVPLESAYFANPVDVGNDGTIPHRLFAGINHVMIHQSPEPIAHALQILRDIVRSGSDPGPRLTLHGHSGAISSVAFSPDGERVITTSEDGTARVWDAATGDVLFVAADHGGAVTSAAVWVDGKSVMTGSTDGNLRQWDVAGNETWKSGYGLGIYSMDISSSGSHFAVGVGTVTMVLPPRPAVYLFDLADGTAAVDLGSSSLEGFYHDVMFSADGSLLVTALAGVYSGAAHVWDTATASIKLTLEGTYPVRTVAISPDGSRALAASSLDNRVAVWDVSAEAVTYEIPSPAKVNDAAFSPDGRVIAISNETDTLRLYNAASGHLDVEIVTDLDQITAVNFSPDGKRLILGSRSGDVQILDR